MADLQIEYLSVASLKPYPRNARTHSAKQLRQIADSMKAFGFTNPLIIDGEAMILAGHGRLAAAKLLGMDKVPCVRLSSMTPAQKKAYMLADNKLALNAGWDEELLALELQELSVLETGFDITLTGFSIAESDVLIDALAGEEPASPAEEVLPPMEDGPAVTQAGDVWRLGRHRLVCGNALDPAVVARLMVGEVAQMVFTDPPYNVPVDGHVSGLGKVRHREFAFASGEMTKGEFTDFLTTAFRNMADHSAEGSIHMIFMDWRHMVEVLEAGNKVFAEMKNLIVWDKGTGGMGTFYRSRHELLFVFKKGTAPHINSFELGQHGRYRTNVWTYRGMNSFGSGRNEEIQLHPTVKPVALIADAIKDISKRNGIVLDLFGGSGSTLIAAHKTGRRGYLCELDPVYCDRIIRRWQAFAKDDAVLEATRESFDDAAARRRRHGQEAGQADPSPDGGGESAPVGSEAPRAEAEAGDDHLVCWLPPFHPVFTAAPAAQAHG